MGSFILGTCLEAECLAVDVVPDGGSWPWVSLVGLQGLTVGRQTLQTGQDSEARGAGEEWRMVIAELWLRKRALAGRRPDLFGLEAGHKPAGAAQARREAVHSPLGTAGRRASPSPDSERCWVRPGRTNAAAGVAGGRVASGRRRRTDKHNAELRSGMHALGGLGRAKGAGRGAALPLGRRMPPSNNEPDGRILRRLQEIRERGEACISPLLIEESDGIAARGWAKAGGVVPPGADRPIRARQPTPNGPKQKHGQRAWRATYHNQCCSCGRPVGGHCYNLALIMISSLYT